MARQADFFDSIETETLESEEDVRVKIVPKLLSALGYPSKLTLYEVPVYYNEGRTKHRPKSADAICYSKEMEKPNREESFNDAYRDSTLFVIEVKKPNETIEDAMQQAEFYVNWTRAPLFCVTNGRSFSFRIHTHGAADKHFDAIGRDELSSSWPEIYNQFSFQNALTLKRRAIEDRSQSKPILEDYCRHIISKCSRTSLKRSLSRKDSHQDAPISALIAERASFLVCGNPGIGKTEFLKWISTEIARRYIAGAEMRIPVLIRARGWARQYSDLLEGAQLEISRYTSEITIDFLRENLNLFCLIVDGIDEARQERDLLFDELADFADREDTWLICSSRYNRDSLTIGISALTLDSLTDKQIHEYMKMNGLDNSYSLFYGLSKSGQELLRNPLHLSCFVAYLKKNGSTTLPRNTASIYGECLLSMLAIKRDPSNEINVASVCHKLGFYALNDLIVQNDTSIHKSFDLEIVDQEFAYIKDHALASGLLIQTDYDLQFSHAVFQEYLAACYLSELTEDELRTFCIENGTSILLENLFEILCGTIRDIKKQAIVLDYLESNNLQLYLTCLKGRLNFSTSIQEKLSLSELMTTGRQILTSYTNVTNAYLKSAKPFIPFWQSMTSSDATPRIEIIYGIRTSVIYVEFKEWHLGEEAVTVNISNDAQGPMIKGPNGTASPILSLTSSSMPRLHIYRTNELFGGIDCAREIAISVIKDDLKGFFANTAPILHEPREMRTSFIEAALRKTHILTKNQSGKDIPLSLRSCTAEDLWKRIEGTPRRIINIAGTEIPIDVIPCMMRLLELEDDTHIDLIPPEPDNLDNFNGCIWDLYKGDTRLRLIETALVGCEKAYRAYIETFFSELSDYLQDYVDGPVMLNVQVVKEEQSALHPDLSIKVAPYPVANIDEVRVVFVENMFSDDSNRIDFENRANEYFRMEKMLGRPGRNYHEYHSSCVDILGDCAYIRNKTIKRVKEEIEKLFDLRR